MPLKRINQRSCTRFSTTGFANNFAPSYFRKLSISTDSAVIAVSDASPSPWIVLLI